MSASTDGQHRDRGGALEYRDLLFRRAGPRTRRPRKMIEGDWSGRVTGSRDQRVEVAMMRMPDGHGGISNSRAFGRCPRSRRSPKRPRANALAHLRVMFAVDDLDYTLVPSEARRAARRGEVAPVRRHPIGSALRPEAPRAFSSAWPSEPADARHALRRHSQHWRSLCAQSPESDMVKRCGVAMVRASA